MEKLAMNLIEYYSTSEPWHLMENNVNINFYIRLFLLEFFKNLILIRAAR